MEEVTDSVAGMSSSGKRPLSVLYVGLKYDYGNPARGQSFEQTNFFHTLSHMSGIDVEAFHFDEVMRSVGREEMNRRLLAVVRERKPDVCFFALFTDEIKKETIKRISESTVTANWFSDDHWRFSSFSRFWGPLFHWVVTTDADALPRYRAIGCRQVILTQWACNHFLYKPYDAARDLDVTFVGQVHSVRKQWIERLRAGGIRVQCWGRGWENGRLSQDEMIRLYSRSRINLNFTESSARWGVKPVAKVFVKRRADGSIRMNSPAEMSGALSALMRPPRAQIKGRNFEIPGSGGFQLTSYAERLEEFYEPGKEVVVFRTADELIEKIRYYLKHEDERENVRRAGYERTMREHTFERRFREMFRMMGIQGRLV
jgi:spore maturation protein CgeB